MPSGLSTDALTAALNGRCDQERLLRGIRDLLGLYWQPNDTPEERVRQAMLYVRDLAEFSDDVVASAISEWRRQYDRRPSIASLRQLCMHRRHGLTAEMSRRGPVEPTPDLTLTDEERERRASVIAKAARDCGFVQNKHGQWELPEPKGAKPERRPHWSETASPDDPRFAELQRARRAAGVISEGDLA